MTTPIRLLLNGDWVEGEELDFEPISERWNEYRCSDGSLVRFKQVVSKIIRLTTTDPSGNPIFHVQSTPILSATVVRE